MLNLLKHAHFTINNYMHPCQFSAVYACIYHKNVLPM